MNEHELFEWTQDGPYSSLDEHGLDDATRLVRFLESRGFPSRVVSAARVRELQDEISERRERSELDEEFDREALSELSFARPEKLHPVRSVVIAAVPRLETEAVFFADGREHVLKIPPTYTDYHTIAQRWLPWLRHFLAQGGYQAVPTVLPLKLLAVRSGLASYGRNNITYVPGLGSYFELVAAYTDIPCEEDGWRDEVMLERCLRCHACVNRCPTQAIRLDRFLLQAERCLVFHNERPGSIPFPTWIETSAHHTAIGCMECQQVCPENRGVRGRVEARERFTGEETAAIIAGAGPEKLSESTRMKLERLDLLRFLDLLPRNVEAALASPRTNRK